MSKEELLNEEWRDVSGYEGMYQVSNLGRLKSLERYVRHSANNISLKKEHIFNVGISNKSLIAILSKEGTSKGYLIYRLVAKAFIPNPENKPEVNHIDGNRMNNKVTNLEWATRSENEKHAYDTGLYVSRKGENHPMSKITRNDILKMYDLFNAGNSKKQIAEIFNISYSHVCRIFKGSTWKHLPDSAYIKKENLKK